MTFIQNEADSASTDDCYFFPVSFAQQRLWFLNRLIGSSSLYNIAWAIRLDGVLDVLALQHGLDALVARHEVLRTGFVGQGGEAVQVINPPLPLACTLTELPDMEVDSDGALRIILEAAANQPFDLTQAPLIRTLLLKLSAQAHVLLVTVHHSIFDGWSLAVFNRDLAALYGFFSLGIAADLPGLPIQYADYAVWQREWLQGDILDRQLNYWRKQLAGAVALALPTDHPRPQQPSYRGAQLPLRLSAELALGLKGLAQQHNSTFFMVLLAALQVLLHRYSGQDDIVVGTVIAGRTRQETEQLLGFFANTLVLRTDVSGDPSFRQLLGRVRKVCLEAYSHQELPFEKLVADMQLPRDRSRHPLFQVMLVLQPPAEAADWPGLQASSIEVASGNAKFDLTLALSEQADGLVGLIEYSTDLFDADTISRMAGHWQTLLAGIVAQPDWPIGELPLLTATERQQLLVGWNATPADYPQNRCIHHLFEAQVARTPHAIAVVFGREQLSYQALNAKANQLAHYLLARGVRVGSLVAIGTERSLSMVIGLLGILKAGAAYIPIDPSYPPARLAYLLADCQAPLLLTQTHLEWPETAAELIYLDTLTGPFAECPESNPDLGSDLNAGQLAYVIYTSGSTGNPKGVMVTHANVSRLFASTEALYGFDGHDVWTLFHSYAFDFSVWELWGAWLYGGKLVIVPYWVSRSPREFYRLLVSEGVTVLNQTPSAFRQLAQIDQELGGQSPLKLRYIIFGGEALDFPSLLPWFARHGDQTPRLVNMYGITETTVHVSYYPVSQADALSQHSIIGKALPDLQAYILDRYLQPQAIGIPGELYIAGAGLAKGYLCRPELTAERFIAHPFSDDPTARLYKTGDLARWLADGTLDYLGRIDQQIKLRGFRIELGEIEALLLQQETVTAAVVVLQGSSDQDSRLIAYIVPALGADKDSTPLRAALKAGLPDYMVPSAWVFLESLSLTAHGKIDRKALPPPDQTHFNVARRYVPPASPVEAALAAVWQEVLAIAPIGRDDNFFELGGHSLLALTLCTQIEAKLKQSVPVEWLFQYPTVSLLAEVLGQGNAVKQNASASLNAFQADGTKPPFFWGVDGKIFSMLLENIGTNQPLYLLKHQSLDGYKARHRTIADMAAHYIRGIQAIDPVGPYHLGGFSVGGMIMYEVARQLCAQGKQVALLFLLDPSQLSYDGENHDTPSYIMRWRRELGQLHYLGYVVYARRWLKKIKMAFVINFYFGLGKPVPARLFWQSIEPIYLQAMLLYKPEPIRDGLKKVVFVHSKQAGADTWLQLFNDKPETYAIDCEHMQLKDDAYLMAWLGIFKRVLEKYIHK
ncbi:amino acid adenylation domain-containing protein [Methylovulum psychrotolerans]|uniref:non-ribosomal peptide synthetase n=1 Tax=Methylovulum psychrotolerans TaxID=1704499 RepID=UPI001BFF223A|nr:non-ribosomal peptide synthetase [Methylovulum psychrotolerans]MBT9097061.1 amino acid adenylation domain-containing protein [Methylovulum psychrotolerans]